MSKPEFIPIKLVWCLPGTGGPGRGTDPVKVIGLTSRGVFGTVLSPKPGVHRDRQVLLAAVERHYGVEFSAEDVETAEARYAAHNAKQTKLTAKWRASKAADALV